MRGIAGLRLVAAMLLTAAWADAPDALALDGKGNYALRGIGGETCQALMEQLQQDPQAPVETAFWLLGYMTAINHWRPDTYDISPVLDASGMLTMLAEICRKHPEAMAETAVTDLLKRLAGARVKTLSPVVETRSGANVAPVRAATLAAMQAKLQQLAYFKGKANGSFDPQTEAALKAFQKDQKLPETGIADWVTVVRLLVELPGRPPG
jgi:murein L,D-transpeptidase YcbB/YkuD